MAQVKIVTDTNAFFPHPELIEELNVEIVPLPIRIGRQAYQERVNFSDELFFRKLAQDPERVSVGAPSLEHVKKLFQRLGQKSDDIVCIHVSSALNDIAVVARKAAKSLIGQHRIVVLDTATTSVGVGLIVEAAAKAAADGAPVNEVVRIVHGMIPHMYALFFSDTLDYLEAWGRIGPAQAMLGTMLNLKPFATMEDGELLPIEKVRDYEQAIEKIYKFVIEFSHIEQMYLVQHEFETETAQLLEQLDLSFPNRDFPVIDYPPSLAVHIGPKALGVVVYEGY